MFRIIFKDLRVSPLRTFLTGFSMFIGILSMILAVLVGTIGKDSLLAVNAQISGFTPTYSISISGYSLEGESGIRFIELLSQQDRSISVRPDGNIRFSLLQNIDELSTNKEILYKNLKHYDTFYITEKFNTVYNLPIYEGSWFSSKDSFDRFEIVVNKAAKDAYDVGGMVMSADLTLSLLPMNVIGVVNDGKDWPVIYVNVKPLVKYTNYFQNSSTANIYWHTKDVFTLQNMQSSIEDLLYDSIGGKAENVIQIDNASNYDTVIGMLQNGLVLTSILLLFVSILGQINIGLASLEYRTHELLIRRALGASRISIAIQVLGNVIFLSVVVCIVSITLSVIIVKSIPLLLPVDTPISPPTYPFIISIIVVAVSVLTALLGGLIPAIKASKLEPALALR